MADEQNGGNGGRRWTSQIVTPLVVATIVSIGSGYVTTSVSLARMDEQIGSQQRVIDRLERWSSATENNRFTERDADHLRDVFQARLEALAARLQVVENVCAEMTRRQRADINRPPIDKDILKR